MFKKILVPALLLAPAAFAETGFNYSLPECHLKKSVNQKWVPSDDMIEWKDVKQLSPLKNFASYSIFRWNNQWYTAPKQCFVTTADGSMAPPPAAANAGASASSDKNHHQAAAVNSTAFQEWYVEVFGGLPKFSGDTVDAAVTSTATNAGTLVTSRSALSAGASFGIAVGTKIDSDNLASLFLARSSATQTETFTGATTGTFSFDGNMLVFGLGLDHYFLEGDFRPFVGARLGLGVESATITATAFPSTAYNGSIDASGSGLYYGIAVGAKWKIADSFSLIPTISYNKMSVSTLKYNSSTSALITAGGTGPSVIDQYLGFTLGVRYSF